MIHWTISRKKNRTSVNNKSVITSDTRHSKSDAISSAENSIVESEQIVPNSNVGVVPNELQVKPSSILRDPRLSSSSSRSSWDSTEGHVLVRSDSVSSVEDATPQKSNPERKQYSEKFDPTSNTKKKVCT